MYVVKRDGHQETLYFDKIIARLKKLKGCSSLPDAISAVDYVTNRGELEEAKTHFDKLISMKFIRFKGACNALLEEL
ncbi:Ribonucleoside-diphosphate reductase large subunit [Camellia lanceoleosa]|nr:Ribonucleoside-diphosphate reductase large subunit [Camellia lanceoleosa]